MRGRPARETGRTNSPLSTTTIQNQTRKEAEEGGGEGRIIVPSICRDSSAFAVIFTSTQWKEVGTDYVNTQYLMQYLTAIRAASRERERIFQVSVVLPSESYVCEVPRRGKRAHSRYLQARARVRMVALAERYFSRHDPKHASTNKRER